MDEQLMQNRLQINKSIFWRTQYKIWHKNSVLPIHDAWDAVTRSDSSEFISLFSPISDGITIDGNAETNDVLTVMRFRAVTAKIYTEESFSINEISNFGIKSTFWER